MKKIEEYSKVLELSKEDVASLNNEELNSLQGGVRPTYYCTNPIYCVDTETTPRCLTIDPKIPCV
ncbi:class I lanthipeptide [Williamwhitmania taraxaci]|uniref:class I lanthipeptide n=1 Tax=Williamwhitmania taraxaci TaxID=1640674 RepID=UPI000F76E03F|nr:class I lanthipeptide [Williamwhitmania taraxaci]